jgi:SnoaL-like domain
MTKQTRFACALWALMAATPALAHEVTDPRVLAERQVAGQVQAWNRGDLEDALSTYCPSADITWVSNAGISRGFDGFRRGMQSMFGGGVAKMGTLDIQVADTRLFGDGSNLTVVRWSITRGGSRLMGGISTQLWADCDGKMRIVFEHSS